MSFIRKIKRNGKIYLAEVENIRVNGKVVQRHIKYIGKEADGKTILASSISNIQIDEVKVFGPLIVLDSIAKSIHLDKILEKHAPEILSMVYAHCLDYKSLNQMESWYERTDLNFILDLESVTEYSLVNALDYLENVDAAELQKKIFENVKKEYKLEKSGIVYDVTNTYLYGKKCPLAKFGKDKENVKGRPLIQIGLGVTQKEGIPIFHKVYNGNVHDSRIFSDSINDFKKYDFKKGLIVFDRGITSKENQKSISDLNWAVLCGIPLDKNLKKILREITKNKKIIDYENRIKLNKTIFYVVDIPHIINGIKGKLLFCFNEQLKKELKESRYDELENAQNQIIKNQSIKSGLEFFFDKNSQIIKKQIEDTEEFDGYSVIFSTTDYANKELVKMYFDKDIVEKSFQSLKGVVKLRPIRHWLYKHVISHIFICYLALLLLSLLKQKLLKLKISPVSALQELETLYKIYMKDSKKDFNLSKIVALTKIQEKILKSVDKNLVLKCSV